MDTDRFRRPALFYRSAREGFEDLLLRRLERKSDGVLLPAFIGWSPREGSGVFDPVSASGARAAFYTLNPDLTVDMGALERALDEGSYRTLVLIHYFGRTEPKLGEIRALTERHDVLLVEDLAHGFFSAQVGDVAGRSGGVSLYSLHKMFPVPAGGMMIYRDPSLLTDQVETAPELAKVILNYDWQAISDRRRETFELLSERLQALPEMGRAFAPLWPQLAPTDTPQTLPVRILGADRDHIYRQMNSDGYGMTSLYHTLIKEVREGFPEMIALSRTIINFPVHQDASPAQIDGMVRSFQAALGSSPEARDHP